MLRSTKSGHTRIISVMYFDCKNTVKIQTTLNEQDNLKFESYRYFPYLKAKSQRVPIFRFFIGGAVTFTKSVYGVGFSGEFLIKTTTRLHKM